MKSKWDGLPCFGYIWVCLLPYSHLYDCSPQLHWSYVVMFNLEVEVNHVIPPLPYPHLRDKLMMYYIAYVLLIFYQNGTSRSVKNCTQKFISQNVITCNYNCAISLLSDMRYPIVNIHANVKSIGPPFFQNHRRTDVTYGHIR